MDHQREVGNVGVRRPTNHTEGRTSKMRNTNGGGLYRHPNNAALKVVTDTSDSWPHWIQPEPHGPPHVWQASRSGPHNENRDSKVISADRSKATASRR